MKSYMLLLSVLLLHHTVSQAQHHAAKSNPKITEQVALTQMLDEPGLKDKEVQMLIVDFPPGVISAAHRHPCETFGYLLEGELESEFEGKKILYKKGDSFYERPNGLHSLTRNPNLTQTAKLLVFFILDKGQSTSVREPR